MPRGEHPNSRKALKENAHKFNSETAAEAGRKSKAAQKKLKTFRELDAEHTTDAERKEMLDMLKKLAKRGNVRAWELYRDTMGMKPVDKVENLNTEIIVDLGGWDEDQAE